VRDLARFGLAYLDGGHVGGSPLIPADWVIDTQHGTDDSIALFATSERAELGWSHYRNGFWVIERDQVFSGLGIFGQYCYVHRPSNTVIARFSTYPKALPEDLSAETLGAFAAVCASLMG
jgi:CubicO group peptidase (beta-lactamase class C family)